MASNDELVRLILDVEGGAAIDDLNEHIGYTSASLDQLKAAYDAGDVGLSEYLKTGKQLQSSLDKLVGTMASVTAAQHSQVNATTEAAQAWAAEANAALDAAIATREAATTAAQAWAAEANAALDVESAAKRQAIAVKEAAEAERLAALAAAEAAIKTYELADSYNLEAHASDNVTSNTGRQGSMLEGLSAKQTVRKLGILSSLDAEKEYNSVINAGAAYSTKGAAALGSAGKGASKAAYQMQMLGNTIDDLQYVPEMGLRPILNNIMMISPAIGIGLVAFEMLRKAVVSWIGEAEKAQSPVEKLKDKLDALNAKPLKLAVDLTEIDTLTARIKTLEERKSALESTKKGSAQDELEKATKEAVTDAGGGSGALSKSVSKALGPLKGFVESGDITRYDELSKAIRVQEKLFGANKGFENLNVDQQAKYKDIRKRAEAAKKKEADDLVADVVRGDPAAIRRLKGLSDALPEAFQQTSSEGETAATAIDKLPGNAAEAGKRVADAKSKKKRWKAFDEQQKEDEKEGRENEKVIKKLADDKKSADKKAAAVDQKADDDLVRSTAKWKRDKASKSRKKATADKAAMKVAREAVSLQQAMMNASQVLAEQNQQIFGQQASLRRQANMLQQQMRRQLPSGDGNFNSEQ
jgi:hypothetical protein